VTARERTEAPFGIAVHRQLKLIHQMLRNDLTTCRELAAEVAAGASPVEVADRIADMRANSPIWTLQVNCLYHCRLVHMHHHGEDRDMFPRCAARTLISARWSIASSPTTGSSRPSSTTSRLA
jgi:hypothetical protein